MYIYKYKLSAIYVTAKAIFEHFRLHKHIGNHELKCRLEDLMQSYWKKSKHIVLIFRTNQYLRPIIFFLVNTVINFLPPTTYYFMAYFHHFFGDFAHVTFEYELYSQYTTNSCNSKLSESTEQRLKAIGSSFWRGRMHVLQHFPEKVTWCCAVRSIAANLWLHTQSEV